ncbi:MAG: hypothetical protein ACRCZ2_14085 [Fusobacteriaceae bacterium]
MNDLISLNAIRIRYKLHIHHLNLVEGLACTRKGKARLYSEAEIKKLDKKKMQKLYMKQVKKFSDGMCLFDRFHSDNQTIRFCELVEKGMNKKEIMTAMKLDPKLEGLVIKKIQYLRGE